jgi:protocatechuate 3,4-dioxygenase beta subunit
MVQMSSTASSRSTARRAAVTVGHLAALALVTLLAALLFVLVRTQVSEGVAALEKNPESREAGHGQAGLEGRAASEGPITLGLASVLPGVARSALEDGVRLRGNGRLSGRALGREDAAPVRGARVELLALPPVGGPIIGRVLRLARVPQALEDRARPVAVTTTDELGEFRFEGVRRGKYYIDVISEYYLPEAPEQVRVLASGEGGPVDVWMRLGGRVSGTVVDPEGRAVADARVMLEPGPNLFLELIRRGTFRILEARTDAGGHFLFGGVAPGSGYDLTATAPEIAVSHGVSVVVAAGEATDVVLRTRRGGRVVGRVLSAVEEEDGSLGRALPLGGAHVGAIPRGLRDMRFVEQILQQTHGITDAEGAYEMSHVPPGEIDVVAYAPNHLLGAGATVTVLESQTSAAPPIEMERGPQLRGRFVDVAGEPVAGVHVRWQTFDLRALAQLGVQLTFAPMLAQAVEGFAFPESDSAGRFVAGPFPGDAPHRIRYFKPGFSDASTSWTPGGVEEVEIVLHRGGSLEGIVMDLEAAQPVTSFSIETIDRIETSAEAPGRLNPFSGGEAFEDAAGRFRLEALRAGEVTLTFEAQGYAPRVVRDLEIAEGEERRGLIVTMSRGATVRGRVVDEEGAPIAGANVMALDPGQRLGRGFGNRRGDFETPPARMLDFAEMLPPGLLGHAAGVGLLGDEAVRSRPDGSFELEGVKLGAATIIAFHPSFAPGSVEGLALEEGGLIEGVEIEVSSGAAVYGTVSDRHGAPIPASMVLALSPQRMGGGRVKDVGGGLYQGETNSAGEYELAHMRPGSYFIVSTRGDEAMNPLSFFATLDFDLLTVPANDRVRFDIVDESLGATRVFGRVLDGGEPAGGGSISALSLEGENFLGIDWKLGHIDSAGNYEFEGLAPGEYQFELRLGGQRSRIPVDVPDLPEHRRDLHLPTGSVSGVVIDGTSREPVRRARVFLRPLDEQRDEGLVAAFLRSEGRVLRQTAATDGTFRFERLSVGEYELLGRPPAGHQANAFALSDEVRLRVVEGGRLDGLSIELRPALTLTGVVRDEEGLPVAGAALACRLEEGDEIRPARATSDEFGHFTIPGLSAGRHTLSASAPGLATARLDGIELKGDLLPELEVVLERGIEFAIRVYGSDGLPLSGASAQLERTDAPGAALTDPQAAVLGLFSGDGATDSEGRLTLGRFVPGVYELTVWRGFLRQTRPSVILERGQERIELRVHL